MRVRLTAASIEWLADHKIFFHSKGLARLKPGDPLEFQPDCEVEPYVGLFFGNSVCPFGYQSYSYSELRPRLTVGRYCSIAQGVEANLSGHPLSHISTGSFTHDPSALLVLQAVADAGAEHVAARFKMRPPPVIEHDVWIGAHARILPGVRIATGAVVAAASVVTRDVAPYEIVAGNPARVVRRRFSDEVVRALLDSEWWRYQFTDFVGLPFDDPARFLDGFLKRKGELEPYSPQRARLAEMPAAARPLGPREQP